MLFINLYAWVLLLVGPIIAHRYATSRKIRERWQVTVFCAAGGCAAAVAVIATLLLTEASHFSTLRPGLPRFIGDYTLVGFGIGLISVVTPESVRQWLISFGVQVATETWRHRRAVVVATFCAMLIQAGGAWVYGKLTAAPSVFVHVDAPARSTRTARLPDESQVILEPGAHLSYTSWFAPHDERELTLDGEGTFAVARAVDNALTLEAHGLEISVSRARFTVRAYDADSVAYVIVHEGLVNVRPRTADGSGKFLDFSGGESARVGPNGRIVRGALSVAPHR